ncbi:hypothetical protein [Candidatus Oscillochloris fontis]|uniref:hypothetical protein n=1 Tax=Candidatus Oscillochloris fontis TaxID=2496868 RepID=UPI00101E0AB0|nr:hypothetical protein [Candidatus Oscillochloris fontis]
MCTYRLADISGPFFDPHKPFRNWSSFPYSQMDLPHAPFVDQAQLAWGLQRAKRHLHDLVAHGYNGIVIDNVAHLVGLDAHSAASSPTRQRAQIYRAALSELFDLANSLGMVVFVTTDMQWSTPDLRAAAGPLDADNPRLADLNRQALRELFTALPQVQGLVVRIGEAGGAHNQGAEYCGHLLYTTSASLRGLIANLLPICEASGRVLIVRTWSVGIGELGDLVSSPARYAATFGDLTSPALLVSVKHTPADFFRLLPANPTLGLPGPRQIIELQNRREYELFGLVPSGVANLHGAVLGRAAADPQCAGFWAWNSTGGWGGGQASLGPDGWNLWTELSSALTAQMATTPTIDRRGFVQDWLRQRFGPSYPPAFVQNVADLYLDSERMIEAGWYVGQADSLPPLGGLHLAPLLWIWWMRPTSALPIWAYLAAAIDDLDGVLARGAAARDAALGYAQRLAACAPADGLATFCVTSAAYFADALTLAHALKALMLPLLIQDRRPTPAQRHALRTILVAHQARWGSRADFPALELAEIEALMQALEHHPHAIMLQARVARMAVATLKHSRALGVVGAAGATGMVLALLAHRRGRTGLAGLAAGAILAAPLRRPALRLGTPWLIRRFNLLPSIFFETGPAMSEWAG